MNCYTKTQVLPVVLFATSLLSCSGGDSSKALAPGGPGPNSAPQPGSVAWLHVSEQTECEAMDPHQCKGAYGFQVNNDGHYIVGPGDNSQSSEGNITPDELNTLSVAANAVATEDLSSGSISCDLSQFIPGINDKVSLTPGTGSEALVYSKFYLQGNFRGSDCYAGDRTQALNLHSNLNALMNKYYTVPFPVTGVWGGDHVQMTVTDSTATLQFDCAHGISDGPLLLDANNHFDFSGTITQEGGPIPATGSRTFVADYSGTVTGASMSLVASFTDAAGKSQSTSYALTYGGSPHFILCPFSS